MSGRTLAPRAERSAPAPRGFSRQSIRENSPIPELSALHQRFGNRATGLLIQTKLRVGERNDRYEIEADRVADQAMRATGSSAQRIAISEAPPTIVPRESRKATEEPKEPKESETEVGDRQTLENNARAGGGAAASDSSDTGSSNGAADSSVSGGNNNSPNVQAKQNGGAAAPPANVEARIEQTRGSGTRLPRDTRQFMESRLGHDFSGVRVHTDAESHRLNHDLNSLAFATGRDIYFGPGQFQPGTASGQHLLAHELTHVIQQAGGRSSVVREKADPTMVSREEKPTSAPPTLVDMLANPPVTQYSVSTSGVTFHVTIRKLAVGNTDKQLMAIVLRAFLGDAYTPKLIDPVLDAITRGRAIKTGLWLGAETASKSSKDKAAPEEHVPDIFLDAKIAVAILYGLSRRLKLHITTTPDQEEVLLVGVYATAAWAELLELHMGPGEALPSWYTKFLFDRHAATHANEFRDYGEGLNVLEGTKRGKDKQADDWRQDALWDIVDKINDEADVVESIRLDPSLCEVSKTLKGQELKDAVEAAAMYHVMWDVPKDAVPTSPPKKANNATTVGAFLVWSFGQPTLAKRAQDVNDHDARIQLLARFSLYLGFAQKSSTGDELLRAKPTAATALPFPSAMTAYPKLEAPLFQVPLDTERRFEHRLMFKTVYEAFSYYHFHWQVVPVKYSPKFDEDQPAPTPTKPEAKPAAPPTTASGDVLQKPPSEWDEQQVGKQIDAQMKDTAGLSKMKGDAPSNMDRLRVRYARAVQYHKEDIKTVFRELGPAGTGAAELATLNAILRYAGAGLGVLFDALFPNVTGTWSDKKIAFPEPGIYIIRCSGSPFIAGEETIVRAPSVAYLPVFVRPAEEIAAAAVYGAEARSSDERAMKTDLDKLLKDDATETDPAKKLTDADRKMLAGLQEDVLAADQGVKASLTLKLKRLEESIAAHEKDQNSNASTLSDEYTERDRLKELLHIQEKRKLTDTHPMHATFVSDGGDTMPLDMEESHKPNKDGTWSATVSDLTTIKSGTDHADGKTKNDAVQNATQKTLESIHGYGRGMVAIEFDGKIITVRIAADVGQIGMEGIENLTTILSIAAIAAAPFTGGATLTLLLPIGAVGAIPSVYRLVERNRVGTLRWDLETAMDLVNIVGSIAGLAEFGMTTRAAGLAAKGLKPGVFALRVGKGVLIINHAANVSGVVLLGGGILAQLDALKGLPEGEARDRRFQIIGGALLQAGIMVGGSLAAEHARGQQERLAAAREVVEGGKTTKGASPPTSGEKASTIDPLEHHLASGEKAPDVKLDPIHTDLKTIPEGRFTWEENIPDPARAMARYNEARARAPNREVAIWRNTKDGTYAVTVGTPHEVHPPAGPHWEGVLHFHPNPTSTTRFALPAPKDFEQLVERFQASNGKVAVREFLDSGMIGGRQTRVEFGIDPSNELPFYVTHEVNGEKTTMRFKDDGTYSQEWNGQTVYVDEGTAKTMRAEVDDWLAKLRNEHAKVDPNHPDIDVKPAAETSRTMTGTGDKPKRRIVPPAEPKPPEVKPDESAAPKRGPLTKDGSLTKDGLDWVRENIKGYEHKSNDQINADFYNHGTPHEPVLRAEKIAQYEGRPIDDPNAYLITKGYRGRKQEPTMAGILNEIRDVARTAGQPIKGDPVVVKLDIDNIVGLIGDNIGATTRSQSLQAEAQALLTHPDPLIRADFQKFYFGEVDAALLTELARARRKPPYLEGSSKGWAHTKVGDIRPDATELNLGANNVKFTDFTQRYSDPVHNFKMRVYNEVARRATGMNVSGVEYRNPRHQTTIP